MQKKYILIVQGEGRGHMTQAIAMYELLINNGNQIKCVIIGTSSNRKIPSFFYEKIKAPIIELPSPNFILKNKKINITKTILYNLSNFMLFIKSLKKIDSIVKQNNPDIIINFYDILTGLYYKFYSPKIKLICIAHQYVYLHPDFEFPQGKKIDKFLIKLHTKITAFFSTKNLALSFYNIHTYNDKVVIVPPLLRKELFNLETIEGSFYLVYLVNNHYFEELIIWHLSNQHIELHCFTDNVDEMNKNYSYNRKKIILHPINDTLFLEMMCKAKGLATSAGFESVCEAMYLGKPVLMVPVDGHYEQYCNSRDGFRAGAGIYSDCFDLSILNDYCNTFDKDNLIFKNWAENGNHRIYQEIISA